MSFLKDKLGRSAVVVAFSLGAFQALSIVGATSASAVGTCSVSGGVMTVAAPNPGDDMTIAVDTNGNIHVAAAAAANTVPDMATEQVPACNGGSGGLATVTTINITGDSGPTTNNQTVFINMAVIAAVAPFGNTTTRANWGTVNWTVNLGSNGTEGDSLVIWDPANTTAGVNITGGANGFDLNSDGDLDISPVVGVEKVYLDSFSNANNNVDLSGSTITGAAFAQGAWIGNTPTAPLNQTVLLQTLTSLMATDTADNTLYGGDGNDVIIGGLAADTIGPGLGSDRVTCGTGAAPVDLGGNFGDDQNTLDYSNTATAINANLPINTVTQGADLDSVNATCLDVIGTAAADTLSGGVGSNWLMPGAQNDTVSGGPAGDNDDTYDVSDATDAVTVDLIAGTSTGGSGSDTLTEIEDVVGGAGADDITGENGAFGNHLSGGPGNDLLAGGVGDGDGPDTFNGGSGIDTLDYSDNTLATNADLSNLTPSGIAGELDVIVVGPPTIENAILGSGDDTFFGTVFNNIAWPNGGQNSLTGCAGAGCAGGVGGIDTVNYSMGYTAGVVVNLSGGGQAGGSASQDAITGFQNAVGTEFNDTLIGTDLVAATNGANLLVGGKGNDNISANAGPDLVRAGAGNDRVRGGSGDDTLSGQGGKDNIRGSGGADDIFGGKGKDFCTGGGGNDFIKTCERPRKNGQGPNGPGLAQRL